MSHSQFHCTGRVYLDLHGLIFETSICYWQDQPGSPRASSERRALLKAGGVVPAGGAGRGFPSRRRWRAPRGWGRSHLGFEKQPCSPGKEVRAERGGQPAGCLPWRSLPRGRAPGSDGSSESRLGNVRQDRSGAGRRQPGAGPETPESAWSRTRSAQEPSEPAETGRGPCDGGSRSPIGRSSSSVSPRRAGNQVKQGEIRSRLPQRTASPSGRRRTAILTCPSLRNRSS